MCSIVASADVLWFYAGCPEVNEQQMLQLWDHKDRALEENGEWRSCL